MKAQSNHRNNNTQRNLTLAKSWRQERKMEVEEAIHQLQWFLIYPEDHSRLVQAQRHIKGAIRITAHANDLSGDSLMSYDEEGE